MKSILFFFSLSTCFILSSQTNLSIFNNSGQRFYVILNGIKQNSMPQTNVSVSGIKDGGYSVKLIFEDGKTRDIDRNFFIDAPSDITTRVVFKKGKGKLQLVSMLPASGSIQSNSVTYRPNDTFIYSDQQSIQTNQPANPTINQNGAIQTTNSNSENFNPQTSTNQNSTNQNSSTQNSTINTPSNNQQMNVNSSNTVTNTSSNVSVGNTPQNVQLSVGVNANGLNGVPTDMLNGNVNLNMNLNGNLNGSINEAQTTQTTITQSQTSSSSTNVISSQNQPIQNNNSANVSLNVNQNSVNTSANPNFNNQNSPTQNSTINTPSNNQQMNVGSSNTVTNTSSNVSVGNTPQNVQLSVGVNANGLNGAPTDMLNGNVNLSINLNDNLNGSINEAQTTQATQTTLTQSQTGSSSTNVISSQNQPIQNNNSANVSLNNNQNSVNTSANPNFNNQVNNSNTNCTKTISDFEGFMTDLKSQSFEDDKVETIKKDLVSSCVYHQQAYKIIETLTFEDNRFEIAKFLFARTLDKQLSERGILPLFTFDSTKMDWREFVRNYR